jgi:ABC-type antimicrobial peptide transport system permease subunit
MGAQVQEIRRLVLRDGAYVALGGFGLGILAAAVFSRPLTTLAFHVTLRDAIVWLPAVAVVTVSTLLASWHPASSAARIDPLVLLRDE